MFYHGCIGNKAGLIAARMAFIARTRTQMMSSTQSQRGVFSVAMKQFNGSSSSNKKKKVFASKEEGNVELLFLFYNRRTLENL